MTTGELYGPPRSRIMGTTYNRTCRRILTTKVFEMFSHLPGERLDDASLYRRMKVLHAWGVAIGLKIFGHVPDIKCIIL